jgi:hypothetical protein
MDNTLPEISSLVMDNIITNSPELQSPKQHSPQFSSTPSMNTPSTSTPVHHCNIHNEIIIQLVEASKLNGKYEAENSGFQVRIAELESENMKLSESLNDLNNSLHAKFNEERKSLLQQIQELTNASTPVTKSKTYRDTLLENKQWPPLTSPVVNHQHQWSTVPKSKSTPCPPNPDTPVSAPTRTSNRYSVLPDENDMTPPQPGSSIESTKPAPKPTCTPTSKPTSKSKKQPKVLLFGDSISKRIDGKRLSRNADIKNNSESGRRIEQVRDDIIKYDCIDADSLIVHVGTNNLVHDSSDIINNKLQDLCQHIKSNTTTSCSVAISSIIHRGGKPELKPKIDNANTFMEDVCKKNDWYFIDNSAVTDLCPDRLHPNQRGISFLATNFQAFLKEAHPSLFQQGRKRTFQRREIPRSVTHLRPLLANAPLWVTALMSQLGTVH